MEKIIHWNEHETILFAVEELRCLMRMAGVESEIGDRMTYRQNLVENNFSIHLILTKAYHAFAKEEVEIEADGFAWVSAGSELWIIGNEPRSVLFGVYEYCKKRFGYKWIEIEKEERLTPQEEFFAPSTIHTPMFARRGNIFETINDPQYVNATIDWGVRHGQNEYFFTFFLWDQIKVYVASELKKRNVNVTLGGHSLSYLLKEIENESETNTNQEKRLKFFAENTPLQDQLIQKIIAICLENEVITRVSLWPEDIGIDEKSAEGFLQTYIRFTERLKEAFVEQGLPVEVEYIVYNAGLSWNMLERETETKVSDKTDALYAYWGRDYSKPIDSNDPNQKRAFESLHDWTAKTAEKGTRLTVLEYYSDHYMLSELFPPLPTRIKQDLLDYKELKIDGILNLIVPVHQKKSHNPSIANYPWKWIHHFNNYMYARLTWGDDFEEIVNDYFSLFNEEKEWFKNRFFELEELLAVQTQFNVPLFPARLVDPEKVESSIENAELRIPDYLRGMENVLAGWDLDEIELLLPIQTNNNSHSFSTKEMALFYFYYLKQHVREQLATWSEKKDNWKEG